MFFPECRLLRFPDPQEVVGPDVHELWQSFAFAALAGFDPEGYFGPLPGGAESFLYFW